MDAARRARMQLHATYLISFLLFCSTVRTASGTSGTALGAFPSSSCGSLSPTESSRKISPYVSNPGPNMFCFNLQPVNCSASDTCCRTELSTFALAIISACENATIMATYNNALVKVTVQRSSDLPSSARLLLIRDLDLRPQALGYLGGQLCLKLPSSGRCSILSKLAVGCTKWSAALLSANRKCCPVTKGQTPPKPPKGSCQSCFVWEVLGPQGTPESSVVDFLGRKTCDLVHIDPATTNYTNCCQFKEASIVRGYESPDILSGYNRLVCDHTSIRFCGTWRSPAAAIAQISEWGNIVGDLDTPYGLNYKMCPLSLVNHTVRLYGAVVGSNTLDTRCTPFNWVAEDRCDLPNLVEASPTYDLFPNSSCDRTPGVTPFRVRPIVDIRYGPTTNLHCMDIITATPANRTSPCAKTTSIDKIAFWFWEYAEYVSIQLLTLKDGQYTSKTLTATWGPNPDAHELNIESPGLDLATVTTAKPKICFEIYKDAYPIGMYSVDWLSNIWTALFDTTGECCPTYYSNTY